MGVDNTKAPFFYLNGTVYKLIHSGIVNTYISSYLTSNNITVGGYISPTDDLTSGYTLGTSSNRWHTLYAGHVECTGSSPDISVGTSSNNLMSLRWTTGNFRGLYDSSDWVISYNGSNTYLGKGNVGIGTSIPSYKLHVIGTIYATDGVTALSDIRQKDVITFKYAPNLNEIAYAPIIRYTMKDDPEKQQHVGSIAQYWRNVMPEAVNEANDGTLSMQYGVIALTSVIALAREVKRLKEEVERLKKN
jgi:hypothetical protein